MTDKPEIELVRSAAAGDGDSFCELCSRYYTAMVAIAHSAIGDRHGAEDAAQEAFARAAVKLGSLRNEKKFGSWLAAICRNAANDIAKKNARFVGAELIDDVAVEVKDDGDIETVRLAMRQLPDKAREVTYLRYYDGLTYERISKVLGISEQAINGRLRRARRKLAVYLKGRGFEV